MARHLSSTSALAYRLRFRAAGLKLALGCLAVVGLAVVGFATLGCGARAAELTVTVNEVRSEMGDIRLALYASAKAFEDFEAQIASNTLRAQEGVVTVVFENIPAGSYAIAAFHDENGNGDFDTNFLGIPKEGYGFSNDAAVVLGPPGFEEAAIMVVEKTSTTEFAIIY